MIDRKFILTVLIVDARLLNFSSLNLPSHLNKRSFRLDFRFWCWIWFNNCFLRHISRWTKYFSYYKPPNTYFHIWVNRAITYFGCFSFWNSLFFKLCFFIIVFYFLLVLNMKILPSIRRDIPKMKKLQNNFSTV